MGNTFGHTGNLIFGRAGIGGMTLVGETEGGDALGANVGCGKSVVIGGRVVVVEEVGCFEEEIVSLVIIIIGGGGESGNFVVEGGEKEGWAAACSRLGFWEGVRR